METEAREQPARSRASLEDWFRRLDGGPYPAYRDLQGRFSLRGLILEVLRVQPDPFAGPSRIRLLVPYASTGLDGAAGALPGGAGTRRPGLADHASARALGTRDYLGRCIGLWLESGANGTGHGPRVAIDPHGQQILDRSAVLLRREELEIRLQVDLPARGRRILGREAAALLIGLPERLVAECLGPGALDLAALQRHFQTVEDFASLQEQLEARGWIAFVADGSRLARRGGNDDRPLQEEPVIPFESPPELRREVILPHAGRVPGMAFDPGVTLLCGGGFHGKSTLLRALAAAVVPHVPGDGRELVATRPDAQSARAEDGRAVSEVDLRPFLHDLPFGIPTHAFSTDNASGSTSQAAGILEAIQGGSRLLLIDEDTSATNFMIRDGLMEQLLSSRQEPITPFLDRARTLFEGLGVSSILVIGGSGEYFRVADRVILLDTYRPFDRTADAKRIARERPPAAREEATGLFLQAVDAGRILPRGPMDGAGSRHPGEPRIKALDARRLLVGGIPLDLTGLECLRDLSQARFLGRILAWRFREQLRSSPGSKHPVASVRNLEASFMEEWGSAGLDGFGRDLRGDLAGVRYLDLLAALNRLRSHSAPRTDWALHLGGTDS